MSRTFQVAGLLFIAGALILSACAPATPTIDANAVYTQAAGTVQAELTQAAALTPSATPTTEPTATPEPTQAPTTAEVTPSEAASPAPVFTATKATSPDQAEYVSQSVPDDTKFNPGDSFTVAWKLKNVGTTTWSTSYLFRFYAGDQMKAPATVPFPKEVKPGDTVEISVSMAAPASAGNYRADWVLTNADGVNFFPVFIQIVVGNPPTPTITVVPSATSAPTETTAPTTEATSSS